MDLSLDNHEEAKVQGKNHSFNYAMCYNCYSLSPYLFLLYAEGLSTLINAAKRKGEIRGIFVARVGTRVNHLLFANDCIIFCRATLLEWNRIS